MSPEKPTILTEIFRVFSQSLQANFSIINQVTAAPYHIFPIQLSDVTGSTVRFIDTVFKRRQAVA